MTQSSVKNFFEDYQSFYSSVTSDSIIYSELSSRILKYLRINVIWKHWYSLSHFQTLDESHETSTSWNIKNVKQLQHWIEQDSEVFLEDLNSLWTQRNLDMKACELFDKILSEQIWNTCFEKINKVKEHLNQLNQTFWNQVTELQHQLQSFKEVTSFSFILFNFFKRFQKLSNSFLFTDEKESIWNDRQEKIHDKLEINVNHFDINRTILIYVHFRIEEDAVKVTLTWHQQDSLNFYVTVDDLLNELTQLYDDLDKETNFRREYANLTQRKSKFSEFYSMFQRLFFYLKYYDKQLIVDLWDKIVYHLHAAKLIIKLSFELTFWIRLDLKSSCSHFQLDSSWVEHIFNLIQLDSTRNWVNSTWLVKNLSLTSRELNIEIFPTFALSFCIIFLVESHEEET